MNGRNRYPRPTHFEHAQHEQGEYASTSEVLRAAMRDWMRKEQEYEERLESIRSRISESLDDPRPSTPLDEGYEQAIQALDRHVAMREDETS